MINTEKSLQMTKPSSYATNQERQQTKYQQNLEYFTHTISFTNKQLYMYNLYWTETYMIRYRIS